MFPPLYWPKTVDTGEPFERSFRLSLPQPVDVYQVWSFIGLDQEDEAEMDVEVYVQDDALTDSYPLELRSLHRHGAYSTFESWQRRDLEYDFSTVRFLRVFFRARRMPTVKSIRAHFGLKLMGWPSYEDEES
jgi:hypothetical protein